MLPPAPACRRALQPQLYTPSDSVWISEETLSLVFQRFCAVTKTRKRYGSSVPGPLESRRRLGKRRMTLQSDAVPTPVFGIASLWGSFGEVDRTKWQWKPPTTRDMRAKEVPSTLPKWLVEWGSASEALPETTTQTMSKSRKLARALPFRCETRSFQTALKVCSPEDLPALCDEFNRKLTQALSLSLHAEQIFSYTMKFVFQDLRQAFSHSNDASHRCLALCQAMWDGISSSKVMQPSDFGDRIIGRFFTILCGITMSEGLQTLASNVLSAVSRTQLLKMHPSISRLVDSWVISWQEEALEYHGSDLAAAIQSVSEAIRAVASVGTLGASLERGHSFENDLEAYRQALRIAKEAIISSADSILEAESLIIPHQRSLRALMAVLGHLPPGLLHTIVHQYSSRMPTYTHGSNDSSSIPVQHSWLSLVAQLPNVKDTLFLDTWRYFGSSLEVDSATDIILNYWISRDLFERPALARILFDVRASHSRRKDHSTLFYVIDGEREDCWGKMRLLFRFLAGLGDHQTIYEILVSLKSVRVKVPADIIDETLESIAIRNPLLAQKAFRIYRFIRYNDAPLRLEKCPNFIFSMIDNPDISSSMIWKSLGIPLYESLPSRSVAKLSRNDPRTAKPLSPTTVDHFTRMATLFAHCNRRTQRVAFRNVMQCLFNLRKHNAPITSDFTRAIAHAGITRKILTDGWIAKRRAEVLLELIERAEGTDVAMTVYEVVGAWNRHISERVSERDRALNVF